MRHGLIFPRTEDQSYGRIFPFTHPMFARIIKVEMHLAGVRMRESAQFQLNHNQATQSTVKKEQVNTIPLLTDPQTPLPAKECEIITEFQQESTQLLDQSLFQVAFRVFVL